jgi:hypothetical protein
VVKARWAPEKCAFYLPELVDEYSLLYEGQALDGSLRKYFSKQS